MAAYQEGSTQINSAGIIFSSRPERETELVEETSITSVRSDSALADHVTETAVEIAGQSRPASGIDTVKAASGYMMATRDACDGDFPPETTVVELPTPKELIEIRQRKKVGKFMHTNCFFMLGLSVLLGCCCVCCYSVFCGYSARILV